MAYYSKDVYDRKREYAYNVSNLGIDEIAIAILKKQGITTDDDNFDEKLEDLVEELQPIVDLSHERHEMHSSRDTTDVTYMDIIGNQYNVGETLLNKVNELNKKYHIIQQTLPDYFEIPEMDVDVDDWEEICEYYGIEYDENDYNDMVEKAGNALITDNRNKKDYASETIRQWFSAINEKYGTNFPS